MHPRLQAYPSILNSIQIHSNIPSLFDLLIQLTWRKKKHPAWRSLEQLKSTFPIIILLTRAWTYMFRMAPGNMNPSCRHCTIIATIQNRDPSPYASELHPSLATRQMVDAPSCNIVSSPMLPIEINIATVPFFQCHRYCHLLSFSNGNPRSSFVQSTFKSITHHSFTPDDL